MSTCPFPNLLDPDLFVDGNHYEMLAKVRQDGGAVVRIEDPIMGVPFWAVMKRDEVDFVCKNPLIFSSQEKTAVPQEFDDATIAMQQMMIVNMDPPNHIKYRRIARNVFTPNAVDSYADTFRGYAKEIVDRVASKGKCEFVTDVAAELPLIAILELCGVPHEDRFQFFDWTNAMFFRDDEDMSEGEDTQAAAMEASVKVFEYAQKLADEHKVEPKANIVGALLSNAVDGGDVLTEEEFGAFFLMLIAAGNESTRSVTAHGMRLLMENPDQLQMLVDDPSLIPDAIEEVLRYNPAFMTMRRTAMEDVELGGQQIKKGDKVCLLWHSINHDEEIFDDPLKFDILRAKKMPTLYKEHRAFGVGQHFCLGAHLARLEMQVMFEEILPRLRNITFDGDVKFVRDSFVNGIREMNVTFDPEVSSDSEPMKAAG